MTKQEIISEIRRTAKASGGVPLGQNRFFSETGIKVSAWRGKYWARWGDALAEAGFEANSMQQAYDEAQLFDHYMRVARELGRLPTLSEIDLRHRQDKRLPTTNAYRRFGSKDQLAVRILEYARQRPAFSDVLEHFAPLAAKAEALESDSSTADQTEDAKSARVRGYVYLVRHDQDYKVGRSNDATRRRREVSLLLPQELEHVHIIETDDPEGIERYWHQRFEARRIRGEWFRLTPDDVRAFRRRRYQ